MLGRLEQNVLDVIHRFVVRGLTIRARQKDGLFVFLLLIIVFNNGSTTDQLRRLMEGLTSLQRNVRWNGL